MPKHADGPKSGRMGYGFEQAKGAGVPYTAPRPIGVINAENRQKNQDEKRLARIQREHPDCRLLVEQWAKAGWTAAQIIQRLENIPVYQGPPISN